MEKKTFSWINMLQMAGMTLIFLAGISIVGIALYVVLSPSSNQTSAFEDSCIAHNFTLSGNSSMVTTCYYVNEYKAIVYLRFNEREDSWSVAR